jgi:hypothetical protein
MTEVRQHSIFDPFDPNNLLFVLLTCHSHAQMIRLCKPGNPFRRTCRAVGCRGVGGRPNAPDRPRFRMDHPPPPLPPLRSCSSRATASASST